MEVSHILGFLKIVKESIKLVPKNGKMMASIAILSLLLPSLVLFLFVYLEKSFTKKVDEAIMVSMWSGLGLTPNLIITFHFALVTLAIITCAIAIGKIASFSATAVILVSAMSYAGKKATVATFVINFDHNAITITTTIVGCVIIFFYMRYVAVVGLLATVVSVVEERCEGAMKRAEELVVGHRLQGFMLNLFVVFPIWNVFLAYRVFLDDKWYLNITTCGMLYLSSSCLGNFFFGVTYTVLYFQCKKHHGQEIRNKDA